MRKLVFVFLAIVLGLGLASLVVVLPASAHPAEWGNMTNVSNTTQTLEGVWGANSSDVFAVGVSGTILRYNGSAWVNMTSASLTAKHLKDVWGANSSNVFAVGDSGTIVRYNGSAWVNMTSASNTTKTLRGVWGSSSSDVFAVGASGTIVRYNGSAWVNMTSASNTTSYLYSVWGSSSSDVFAVGLSGTIVRYNGTAWINMTNASNTTSTLYSIWGTNSSNVFAVGDGGTIVQWNGSAWLNRTSASNTTQGLWGVWGSSSSDVFAVGASGTIVRYNGTAWVNMTSASLTTQHLYGVWGNSSTDVFAVGGGGTILHYSAPVAEATVAIESVTLIYNSTGTVDLTITTNTAWLGAATIDLSFNNTVVQVLGGENSDFDSLEVNPSYNPTTARFVAYQTGAAGVDATGGAVLARVNLQAVGDPGSSSPLTLTVITLRDNVGTPISYTTTDGEATIIPLVATTLVLTPESAINILPGDTSEQFTLTVTDQLGNPMAGQVVSLATTFGTLSDPSVTSGAAGTATFTISSSLPGSATITAGLGDLTDTSTKTWTYTPVATTLVLTPESAINILPGNTSEQFTLTVTDQLGNPMAGQVVNLSTTSGTLNASSVTTGDAGTANFTISSSAPGSATITATLGALTDTSTKTWRYTLGDASGNGTIDAFDCVYIARAIAGFPGYDIDPDTMDVSGDGIVDAWDCTYLARFLAGIPGYALGG